MKPRIKTLKTNTQGTDYYVGDIHGCYNQVMSILDEIGFDKNVDRLICVGDLCDRGVDSYKCLTLLDEPWFHVVLGNHEDMMYKGLVEEDRDMYWCWMSNGGGWDTSLTEDEGTMLDEHYLPKIKELPHMIVCDGVAVVHADYFNENTSIDSMLWGRKRITNNMRAAFVKDYKAVVCGHTPVDTVTTIANCVYIDTGGWYNGGHFAVISREQVLREVGIYE